MVNQPLSGYVRMLLTGMFFHGMELCDEQLMKVLECHGEC